MPHHADSAGIIGIEADDAEVEAFLRSYFEVKAPAPEAPKVEATKKPGKAGGGQP